LIVFPNSKINLGLRILRKREDGYHDLDSLLYPVAITDALEIITLGPHEHSSSFPFTLSGAALKGQPTSNLCVRAYKLLKKDFPDLPRIKMHLHKNIPSGAGLGGGSADAAFTLVLLNKMYGLGIAEEKLLQYAAELGSDCPFFIINKPCFANGRGEILEQAPISLSDYQLMIINPGIHVDTGLAFLNITPSIPEKSVREIILHTAIERWKDDLVNDFEKAIFPRYPEIADIKDTLYSKGAVYASMSGSGSTVYGIFRKGKMPEMRFPEGYFVRVV
jgi:4-diphosphocytidyl-2-C-methyl-D-erythritol kinase